MMQETSDAAPDGDGEDRGASATITPTQDAPGTPLPWECHKTLPLIHHWKQGPDDDTGNVLIAEVGSHRDAELEPFNGDRWLQDARYIVLACNAYPELVAALEALVPMPFVCGCCQRPMTWLREHGASQQATLQHDRDGGLRIICLACNTRHAQHPGDTFYDVPAGRKRCPDCEAILPLASFAVDRSRPIGRKSYCRDCSALRFKNWEARHAA